MEIERCGGRGSRTFCRACLRILSDPIRGARQLFETASAGFITLDGATRPVSMPDPLKTLLPAQHQPGFWIVQSIPRFFRRGTQWDFHPTGFREAITASGSLRPPKKQRFPAGEVDSEVCDERNSLPDSKVAWRRNQAGWARLQVAENKSNIVERKLNYYILLFGRMPRAGS